MIYTNYLFFKKRLKALGVADLPLDNNLTDDFSTAIRKLQASHGLEQVGYVGPQTLNLLVKNSYPELQVLPYKQTTIDEKLVINYIKSVQEIPAVKISTYLIFANESAHGRSGINSNYVGGQADVGRWNSQWDDVVYATTIKCESMTGNPRRFLVFNSWQLGIEFLVDRVQSRGLFIGGHVHPYSNMDVDNVEEFAKAYWDEWVVGDSSNPPSGQIADIVGLYKKAETYFT